MTGSEVTYEVCPGCGAEGEHVPLLGAIWKCGTHQHCGRQPVRTRECIDAGVLRPESPLEAPMKREQVLWALRNAYNLDAQVAADVERSIEAWHERRKSIERERDHAKLIVETIDALFKDGNAMEARRMLDAAARTYRERANV